MANSAHKIGKDDSSHYYIGNYRILRLLGSGGFASVYLGEHHYLKRPAAIKVLHTVLAEEEKIHFLKEARLLANLSHPRIVRVLEFATMPKRIFVQNSVVIENIPFLVMDYISGGNLRTIYPEGTRLFLDMVIMYVKQIAQALHYAHTNHVIHRDIKPENLLLNEQHEIMLSDFGLALFAPKPGLISRQNMAGTLPYSAPEQLQGKPEFASDQYSLAIVAYEWLCGSPPFYGGDAEVIMQHISSPPPPLSAHNISIPLTVEKVLRKALEKDPAQRYENVQAFAQALQDSYEQHSYAIQLSPVAPAPQQAINTFPVFYYLSQKPIPVDARENTTQRQPQAYERVNKPRISSSRERNRLRMLHKMYTIWISGVLEPSLHEGIFINLALQNNQDVVASAWPIPHYQHKRSPSKPALELSIIDAYDQAGGELLILGEAGSGKTILLLHLARQLLQRAEQNEDVPLPVIFLLSSWAEKQLPLDQWFVEELNIKYQVPRPLAEQWIQAEVLLPMLDGLDEVDEKVRSACIVAINTYKQQHGLNPLVVTSRLNEYLLFPPRVLLQRAIVVQPLSKKQIDEYFQQLGGNFTLIAQMLQFDLLLYELITTPLMLNIITLAYQDTSPTELLRQYSSKERYQKILDTYVEQMLHHHVATHSNVRPQQLLEKLSYLAQRMQQCNETVFYVEQMQPTWIDKNFWLRVYLWLAVLLPGMLVGALTGILANVLLFHTGSIGAVPMDVVYGTVMGYVFSNRPTASLPPEKQSVPQAIRKMPLFKASSLQTLLVVGLITSLCVGSVKGWNDGLICGLALGLVSIPIYKFIHRKPGKGPNTNGNAHLLNRYFPFEHFKNSLLIGIACGLISIVTLFVTHTELNKGLIFFLSIGIRDSLRNVLIGTLLSLLLLKNNGIIVCAEVVSWSWKRFWNSFRSNIIFFDLLFGIFVSIIFGSKQLFQDNINNVLSTGLSAGFLVMIGLRLASAISQGVSSNRLSDSFRVRPNEGIRRSLFHGAVGLSIGAAVFLIATVLTSVLSLIFTSGLSIFTFGLPLFTKQGGLHLILHLAFINSLLLVPIGGLAAALLLGWFAAWQHGILRCILHFTSPIPFNLIHFLNDAVDSVLLRRIGGGYIFVHRTFLDYFATCNHPAIQNQEQPPSTTEPIRLVRSIEA